MAATVALTDLMDTPWRFPLLWSFVSPQRGYYRRAAIPKEGESWALPLTHRISELFRQRLISTPYLTNSEDEVGLSPVSTVSHCVQAMPPSTPYDPTMVTATPPPKKAYASQRFRLGWALAPHRGRNVTPPELSEPGLSVTGCYRPMLSTYPSNESSSSDFHTGTDPRG